MVAILRARGGGIGAAEWALLALFIISFLWISFCFWAGFIGFLVRVFTPDPVSFVHPGVSKAAHALDPHTRIAVVMPVHNEDVRRVFAGIRATYTSVVASGYADRFEFFYRIFDGAMIIAPARRIQFTRGRVDRLAFCGIEKLVGILRQGSVGNEETR